ncbi:MAG: UbiD family decarboxylase [Dehalococcoidia bacterium]
MPFTDLQSFLIELENQGELIRVSEPVDPVLEVTEIATRAVKEQTPAIIFENVLGSKIPLVINSMASMKRLQIAIGRAPEELGEEILSFVQDINPPKLSSFWRNKKTIWRLLKIRPKKVRGSIVQQEQNKYNLSDLPILKCWPEDGGKFITLPLVISKDPEDNTMNMGMYRMQVYDSLTTGMHMQIQKGGGFHYRNAEKLNQPLDMAVAIGGDPSLILASIMPLPEGLDEVAFSGIVRGKRTPITKAKTVDLNVPSNAEFILEGRLQPKVRRLEGPFGDHFGHYSQADDHPVFEITNITSRKNPVYPATVVGKPPQEDKFLGDAAQLALTPLIKVIRKDVIDMWAYYEAGFHNLLVVSVDNRYEREPLKTALGLLGEGQLSLTKTIILIDHDVDPKNYKEVIKSIRKNFTPESGFHLLSKTAADTLDFTSGKINRGSKMIIDATTGKNNQNNLTAIPMPGNLSEILPNVKGYRFISNTLLVIATKNNGRDTLISALQNPLLSKIKIIVVVSRDVDIYDDENLIWGIFTRFDAVKDVMFSSSKFVNIAPVYSGVMGIDATWKEGYQKPLIMSEDIVKKVDKNWHLYSK